ncbi:MAG: hypothetical protein EBY16_02550 [Gammaproteobacteria bacterium]|nr:hypothetical protein [Gammaproteobacteria bacterium]
MSSTSLGDPSVFAESLLYSSGDTIPEVLPSPPFLVDSVIFAESALDSLEESLSSVRLVFADVDSGGVDSSA